MRLTWLLVGAVVTLLFGGLSSAAQEAPPDAPYKPRARDCTIEPISQEVITKSLGQIAILEATPQVSLGHEDVTDPMDADSLPIAELPAYTPADPGVAAEITALEQEYAACFNAGEFYRAAALTTGESRLVVVALAEFFETEFNDTTPIPPMDYQIRSVAVRDVRILPDGRVGAIVDWREEMLFDIYEEVNGVWLIADEIRLY